MKPLDLTQRLNDDLAIAATALIDDSVLEGGHDVLYFLDKPWKYKQELEKLGYEVKTL